MSRLVFVGTFLIGTLARHDMLKIQETFVTVSLIHNTFCNLQEYIFQIALFFIKRNNF